MSFKLNMKLMHDAARITLEAALRSGLKNVRINLSEVIRNDPAYHTFAKEYVKGFLEGLK